MAKMISKGVCLALGWCLIWGSIPARAEEAVEEEMMVEQAEAELPAVEQLEEEAAVEEEAPAQEPVPAQQETPSQEAAAAQETSAAQAEENVKPAETAGTQTNTAAEETTGNAGNAGENDASGNSSDEEQAKTEETPENAQHASGDNSGIDNNNSSDGNANPGSDKDTKGTQTAEAVADAVLNEEDGKIDSDEEVTEIEEKTGEETGTGEEEPDEFITETLNNKLTLIRWEPSSDEVTRAEIPDGVEVIGPEAFDMGRNQLETVKLPDSLTEIQERAFAGCVNLSDIEYTENIQLTTFADNAFEGCSKLSSWVIEELRNQLISLREQEATIASLNDEIKNLKEEKKKREEEEAEEPTMYDVTVPTGRSGAGGSASSSSTTRRYTHGRSTTEVTHGYDQVNVLVNSETEKTLMHTLTLDGEELPVTLNNTDGENMSFTLSLYDWQNPYATPEQRQEYGDTLILRAYDEEEDTLSWQINGSALRKLSKSGIDYLVFQQGDSLVAAPTEGFLAGWAYDDMKSRGLAGRAFQYTLIMSEGKEPRWQVSVENQLFNPGTETLSPLYLQGVENGTEEMLRKAKEEK